MLFTPEHIERFWSYVRKGEGCWEWQAARHKQGYGVIGLGGRQWKAHRVSYILAHGAIPTGRWICHHCDNTACVRPAHLYAGTATDNNRDTVRRNRRAAPKTHCKRGHEFTPENTWDAHPRAGVIHGRRCRICTKMLNRQSVERQRARKKAA